MSESTLTSPRSEILQAIGGFLDFGRTPFVWTREQTAQVTRILRSGERQFYNPPNHSWSFLRLRLELDIEVGTADYVLPDGFGGFFDPYLSFIAEDSQFSPVRNTSVPAILNMRQFENLTAVSQPEWFAVNAKTPTGSTGQRFEVLLFPTPVADGTLEGTYYANPDATTDSLPYAMGGEIHSETLLACCLAAAELDRDKKAGPMKQQYAERLAASIQHDRRSGPKSFGYNSDRSSSVCTPFTRISTVTRNGLALE